MGDLVKYRNEMNDFPLKGFSEVDLNFFYSLCAKVKDRGTDLIELSFAEIREIANYKQTSNDVFIKDLDRMNERLIKCTGHYENSSVIVRFVLFSTFTIDKEKQTLTVRVNQDFTWLLNDIANKFTAFELKQYVSMHGIYAKALYRLLKQWRTQGQTPKYTVDELKEKLATPDYNAKRLTQEVVKPAVAELKQKKVWSNLYVEIVYKRGRGKPIDGYIFHFAKDVTEGQMSIDNYPQYLPNADEQKRRKSNGKNSFNRFAQNTYDFDALEKDVVAN